MPKVSVLMPVYKTPENYLREAIESILNQTFTDFEFLILDDCPDDPREHIVKSYADPRIRYFKNPCNLGISPSRNKLIEQAKGEYLAVFDHDDISLPKRFEKQVYFLDEHPEVGVVSSWAGTTNGGRDIKFFDAGASARKVKLSLIRSYALLHPSAMIRKSVLIDNGIRYEKEFFPAEDYRLWTRILPHADLREIPEILFLYRVHESNTSKLEREKMHEADCAVRACAKTENPALYEELLLRAEHVTRWRLFGLPGLHVLTVVRRRGETNVFLFKKIKILTLRHDLKL